MEKQNILEIDVSCIASAVKVGEYNIFNEIKDLSLDYLLFYRKPVPAIHAYMQYCAEMLNTGDEIVHKSVLERLDIYNQDGNKYMELAKVYMESMLTDNEVNTVYNKIVNHCRIAKLTWVCLQMSSVMDHLIAAESDVICTTATVERLIHKDGKLFAIVNTISA